MMFRRQGAVVVAILAVGISGGLAQVNLNNIIISILFSGVIPTLLSAAMPNSGRVRGQRAPRRRLPGLLRRLPRLLRDK